MIPDESLWHQRLAVAIRLSGEPGFAPALEQALAALLPVQIFMGFAYLSGARPISLAHNMAPQIAQTVVSDYTAGPWLLDPFYAAIQAGPTSGILHLRSLAPDGFFRSEYYRHYRRTGISDEIGFPAQLESGGAAILSIAVTEAPGFTRAQTRLAERIAPVVAALITGHWGKTPATRAPEAPPLDRLLTGIAGGVLTAREIEVIAHVLKGYSATAISARLVISEGTVKVHRKNAYRKLGISSQAELFSRFLAAL